MPRGSKHFVENSGFRAPGDQMAMTVVLKGKFMAELLKDSHHEDHRYHDFFGPRWWSELSVREGPHKP
jgi:hypothetical protein